MHSLLSIQITSSKTGQRAEAHHWSPDDNRTSDRRDDGDIQWEGKEWARWRGRQYGNGEEPWRMIRTQSKLIEFCFKTASISHNDGNLQSWLVEAALYAHIFIHTCIYVWRKCKVTSIWIGRIDMSCAHAHCAVSRVTGYCRFMKFYRWK